MQKIRWIAPSIIAGFAGSVRIGFALLDDLAEFLYVPPEEQGNGSWMPQWVAENWRQRARSVFEASPIEERMYGAAILMVSAHPTEDLGSPRDPRIYTIEMKWPGFEPTIASDFSRIFSIGRGSGVALYRDTLQELMPENGYHPLMQLDVGDTGGWATGIAFQLSRAIRKHPEQGISKYLHVGVVTRRKYHIMPYDWSETKDGKWTEVRMPKVATNWSELVQLLSDSTLAPETARAGS